LCDLNTLAAADDGKYATNSGWEKSVTKEIHRIILERLPLLDWAL
jgi:hypothetical protein